MISFRKRFKEIKERLESGLTEEARKIKEDTNYFNSVNYNRKTLIESFFKIKDNNVDILTDEEKIVLKKQIDEGKKEEIPLLDEIEILHEDQINQINELLKTQIKISEPIQDLLNNSILNNHNEFCKNIGKRKKDARDKLLLDKEKKLFIDLDYTKIMKYKNYIR